MTDAQMKKRAAAAWSPAARKKRKATITARKSKVPNLPSLFAVPGPQLLNRQDPPLFSAEQVMALLKELWRKGP
jgi:hypothetical protein